MTIQNQALNTRLQNLERYNLEALEGTLGDKVGDCLDEAYAAIRDSLKSSGLKADNSDALRDLECAIYEYVLRSNLELQDDFAREEAQGEALGVAR